MVSPWAAVAAVVPGRAKPLQGGVHLVLLASFVFLSLKP
jgi:Ca2+:H+ antiporter